MTESSSSELALREELSKAHDEARQAKANLEQSAKRVSALESECAKLDPTTDKQIRALEEQIGELTIKLKKAEEALTAPSSPELGSPKTQSDDEYIVVEPGSPNSLEDKLKEREAEIRKAMAHASKLEEMYITAEERTLTFEKQVHVLEANMFEKFDDAHALLEKVKELEELLTAGQIQQIAALEEKSKICDEAQKKVEYEKVLFLETEDQLVKNFKKAHDEAEQYRNTIFQLEMSVKIAEEKAAHAEKFLEFSSERNQELESEIADLNFQIQLISSERPPYESIKLKSDTELLELRKTLALFQDKADSLEQELQIYRGREKKVVDDDVRSVDEKNVVHEATATHVVDTLQEVLVGESMDGHASSSDLDLDMVHGKSVDDEMKFLGENVGAVVTHSKLLMSEFAKLQSAHILYACEAESSKTQLKDHVKDLEEKVSQLEQGIMISRESEERMKEETKVMEAKAMEESSLFEGLKMSYADYTSDLERRNAKLEEELIVLREQVTANANEQQKLTLDCDRMRNAESRSESLEALVVDLLTQLKAPRVCDTCSQLKTQLQDAESRSESSEARVVDLQTKLETPRECETCSQLKTQIQDLEVMLGELSLELEVSRRREHDVQREVKSMGEKCTSHEQLASEWMEKAMSQFRDHHVRVLALESRMTELREENLRSQTSIKETGLWAEKAASLLREHVESLHELRGGYADRTTTSKSLGKEEKEALQANVEELHLKFRDVQLCDGSEALQLCKELLSLERDCLNIEMQDIAYRNTDLESELEVLKLQIQNLKNPPESPAKEVKKSFREVTLDGEVQSLRSQLVELQSFRARASEIPSLQAHIAQLQLSLRAAETRELEQNIELVKVQRKVSAAEEELCSLKRTLLNQTQISELREQVDLLVQNLMKSEESNASLKEEIKKSKIDLEVEVTDKVTHEIVLEQAPEPEQQADILPPQHIKPKARKRKNRKSGKVPVLQETTQTADRTGSFRHRIPVFLFFALLVAIVMRFSFR